MKPEFITSLCVEYLTDKVCKVTRPLVYYSAILNSEITVPVEFYNDLSSVPRLPLVYWFWGGRAHHEGVIHDWLFRIDSIPVVSWSTANAVFKEAMTARNKPVLVKVPMHLGLMIGSKRHYHRRYVGDIYETNTKRWISSQAGQGGRNAGDSQQPAPTVRLDQGDF